MYIPNHNCFRADLIITESQGKGRKNAPTVYTVRDPISNQTYEFQEQEYFLCQAMDGWTTVEQIRTNFTRRFGLSISEIDFNAFSEQLEQSGLMEPCEEIEEQNGFLWEEPEDFIVDTLFDDSNDPTNEDNTTTTLTKAKPRVEEEKKRRLFRWYWFDPHPIYSVLASFFTPLAPIFRTIVWLSVPGGIAALFIMFSHQAEIWADLTYGFTPESWFLALFFHLMSINIISRIAQGTVMTSFGAEVREFGLQLRFGAVPRFYIDRHGGRYLSREGQLWSVSSPLVDRWLFFVSGTLMWYLTYGSGTKIGVISMFFAESGLMGFIALSIPIWGEGYRVFVLFFNLPISLLQQALQVIRMTVAGKKLPSFISWQKQLGLLAYGTLIMTLWFSLVTGVSVGTAAGLQSSYPGLLGRATGFIFVIVIGAMVSTWAIDKWRKATNKKAAKGNRKVTGSLDDEKIISWPKRIFWSTVATVGVVALLWPYTAHYGGTIQLLSPRQQNIQAEVPGQLQQTSYKGGDRQFIKAGTLIDKLASPQLENNYLVLQQQEKEQIATLNKFLNNPLPEAVAVAQAAVDTSQGQVEIARKNLEIGASQAKFSVTQAGRYQELYLSGTYAKSLYDQAKTQAEVDQAQVKQLQSNLEAVKKTLAQHQADLALVKAGSHPDDIKAARSALKRVQEQLAFARRELHDNSRLEMPFDGELVTPYLGQKAGSFITQGTTYAVATDTSKVLGEALIPEYIATGIKPGDHVEIKLWSDVRHPFKGRVLGVSPTTTMDTNSDTLTTTQSYVAPNAPPPACTAASTVGFNLPSTPTPAVNVNNSFSPVSAPTINKPAAQPSDLSLGLSSGQPIAPPTASNSASMQPVSTAAPLNISMSSNTTPVTASSCMTRMPSVFAPSADPVNPVAPPAPTTTAATASLASTFNLDTMATTETAATTLSGAPVVPIETTSTYVKVLVQLIDPPAKLTPGLSGYAKVDGPTKPLIVVLAQAFMRWFLVEFWSWLP